MNLSSSLGVFQKFSKCFVDSSNIIMGTYQDMRGGSHYNIWTYFCRRLLRKGGKCKIYSLLIRSTRSNSSSRGLYVQWRINMAPFLEFKFWSESFPNLTFPQGKRISKGLVHEIQKRKAMDPTCSVIRFRKQSQERNSRV